MSNVLNPPRVASDNSEAHRAIQRVRACVASARKLEQLSIDLDKYLAVKAASLKSSEDAHRLSMSAAEAVRSAVLSEVKNVFSQIGETPPPAIGNIPGKQHPTDSMRPRINSYAKSVLAGRQRLFEDDKYTSDATPFVIGGTLVGMIVLACGLHWGALIALALPIGFFMFRGNVKSEHEAQLNRDIAEFHALVQALDEGSAFDLANAKSKADESIRIAEQVAWTEYADRRREVESEIDKIEVELRREQSLLEQGIVQGRWSDGAWTSWTPANEVPRSLRLGTLYPTMTRYKANFPDRQAIAIPALINYESGKGIVVEANRGLPEARQLAQSLVLRLLATVPPAGVRFTFIDPVSLGQNVAGFMNLEKYEPTLIGGKAWSDPQHIDKALSGITEHMETVIQKYLREDYKTIEEYNEKARVKEAYRVVMVFDFPVNFTEQSAKRLASIMRNGPRCGVFPVVIVDGSKPLPYGFNMNDLEQFATVFRRSDTTMPLATMTPATNSSSPSMSFSDLNEKAMLALAQTGECYVRLYSVGEFKVQALKVIMTHTGLEGDDLQRLIDYLGTFSNEAGVLSKPVLLEAIWEKATAHAFVRELTGLGGRAEIVRAEDAQEADSDEGWDDDDD